MPELVLGSNLAALVATAEAAREGREVVLVTDGRPLGGHFRGVELGEHRFDLGRVLVERAEAGVRSSAAQRAEGDEAWTAWGDAFDEVLEQHVDLRRAPTPEAHVLGRRWPDHLVSNRLDVFTAPGLPLPPALSPQDPRHARHKMLPGAYETLDYGTAASANHGSEVHSLLFEPFVRKLMGVTSGDLLARAHRYAWVPLYWPESLAAAVEGRSTGLAEYPFWSTGTGCTADLVTSLERAVRRHPGVVVVDAAVEHLERSVTGWTAAAAGRRWSGPQIVLGLAPARAAELLGTPPPARRSGAAVGLVLCTVEADALRAPASCLFVTDARDPVYRISDHEALSGSDGPVHRVVVEVSGAALDGRDAGAATADAVTSMRRHLGVEDPGSVQVLRTLVVPDAKPVPSPELVRAMAEEREALEEAAPGAVLTGALLDHASASLNDQVVQGWRAVHEVMAPV